MKKKTAPRLVNVPLFSLVGNLIISLCIFAYAENIVFPSDAGIIDVTKAPYNANSHGAVNATTPIQQALNAYPNGGVIIYLPNGTYLVNDTLKWPNGNSGADYKNVIMQGQSRLGTVIRLANAEPGYTNASVNKPVLWTGPRPAQRFRIAIRNLTVNTGTGNPGAVGIEFNANNQGCLRDVAITSGDGQGLIGLDMGFTSEIGPLLVKNLTVDGFDLGIRSRYQMNSQILEHITLRNQKKYGYYNWGQTVAIRDLNFTGNVPAVFNDGDSSFMNIIGAKLTGTGAASSLSAIINSGTLYARDCSTAVYGTAINNLAGNISKVNGPVVYEFVSHAIKSLFSSPQTSLHLPIAETPEVPWDENLSQWTRVAPDLSDATKALQDAIDRGNTTVYLPRGKFVVSDTISIRGNVRRIIGCEGSIEITPAFGATNSPVFMFRNGNAPVVVLERFSMGGISGSPTVYGFKHVSNRTLVLKDISGWGYKGEGPGDVYIEDITINQLHNVTFKNQKTWIRQLNVENNGVKTIFDNTTGWILGLKTERPGTVISAKNGSSVELYGGFTYGTMTPELILPWFNIENSSFSASACEINLDTITGNYHWYAPPESLLVREVRGNLSDTLYRADAARHMIEASKLPLYVGYSSAAAKSPVAYASRKASVPVKSINMGINSSKRSLPADAKSLQIYDLQGRLVWQYDKNRSVPLEEIGMPKSVTKRKGIMFTIISK